MIYASGLATFFVSKKQFNALMKFKHEMITLELKQGQSIDSFKETQNRLIYEFTAILPRNYECRSLEDYTGKVKPYLEESTNHKLVSVQVSHLNYLSEQAIQALRKKK